MCVCVSKCWSFLWSHFCCLDIRSNVDLQGLIPESTRACHCFCYVTRQWCSDGASDLNRPILFIARLGMNVSGTNWTGSGIVWCIYVHIYVIGVVALDVNYVGLSDYFLS